MPEDLPFDEYLVLVEPLDQPSTGRPREGAADDIPDRKPVQLAAPAGAHLVHVFGDRVAISLDLPDGTTPAADAPPAAQVPTDELARLTLTERLGVQALALRQSPDYREAKRHRARAGETWDMPSCSPPPPPAGAGEHAETADAGAPGTSDILEGSVAVGIVIVNGPTADLQFSAAEQTKVVAEVQAGLSFHAGMNLPAELSFHYDLHVVTVDAAPNPNATNEQKEPLWRDPAMRALGYSGDWSGVLAYVSALRTNLRTRWAYCVFFVKYPLYHFAYAGGPRIVMQYANDGWGEDNIDRVFAHETGHVFGCPDEYAASQCNCTDVFGPFAEPNRNCETCATGVACIMKNNDWAMCPSTPRHLGWGLSSLRTSSPGWLCAASSAPNRLDAFVVDGDGAVRTAAWQPGMPVWWQGWTELLGGRARPGAPVTAVSRRPGVLDVFVVGLDGHVYTASHVIGSGWAGWWRIGTAVVPQGAYVGAVSRSLDHLDVFVVDTAGKVLTAAWEPAFTDGWHGWWELNGGRAAPGAPVTAVSRSTDKLDVFVTGLDGSVYTAAWEPGFTDWWHGWWRIGAAVAPQGAYVGAVSRSRDHLDVFVVDTGSKILTAAWEPAFADGWHGWWELNGGKAAPGSPVVAVSRSTDKLDVFVTGLDGHTYTAAWEPGFTDWWHGWWNLNGGMTNPGSAVTAVSRSTDQLDAFVVGTDGRPYTAAWEPGFTDGWHGWWGMGG